MLIDTPSKEEQRHRDQKEPEAESAPQPVLWQTQPIAQHNPLPDSLVRVSEGTQTHLRALALSEKRPPIKVPKRKPAAGDMKKRPEVIGDVRLYSLTNI